MQELVEFAVKAVSDHPDDVVINLVEGKASLLFELNVSDSDRERLMADERALLGSIQAVMSASSGRQRAMLELVDPAAASEEE